MYYFIKELIIKIKKTSCHCAYFFPKFYLNWPVQTYVIYFVGKMTVSKIFIIGHYPYEVFRWKK